MRDIISAGQRGKSCRRAFSNDSIACPPGKCPVARLQSDTLRPADWTIGYSSPRSDIAVTTNYRTGIAAELGCALHRRQFLPGNSAQLFRHPEKSSITRVRRAIHHSMTRCRNRRGQAPGPDPGGFASDKPVDIIENDHVVIVDFADTGLRRQALTSR
jgi:hypothetical protein